MILTNVCGGNFKCLGGNSKKCLGSETFEDDEPDEFADYVLNVCCA